MVTRPHLRCRWLPLHRARLYVADHRRHLPAVTGAILAIGGGYQTDQRVFFTACKITAALLLTAKNGAATM
jgi:hypothetical protein